MGTLSTSARIHAPTSRMLDGTIVIEATPVRYGGKWRPSDLHGALRRFHRAGLVAIDVLVGVDTFPLLNLHSDMLDAETTSQGAGHAFQYDLPVGGVIAVGMQGHYWGLSGQRPCMDMVHAFNVRQVGELALNSRSVESWWRAFQQHMRRVSCQLPARPQYQH